jgi:hypothetical protein
MSPWLPASSAPPAVLQAVEPPLDGGELARGFGPLEALDQAGELLQPRRLGPVDRLPGRACGAEAEGAGDLREGVAREAQAQRLDLVLQGAQRFRAELAEHDGFLLDRCASSDGIKNPTTR